MERVAFLIEATGERIDCLLNPETVVFRRQAGIQRRSLIGNLIGDSAWSDDTLVCGGGGQTELQLDLLFDTSLLAPPKECDDVQTLTAPFWGLAEHAMDSNGHYRPHVVRLMWGKAWNLPGIVAAVAERFECFLPSGAPQRSWLRMKFIRVADADAQSAAVRGTTSGTASPLQDGRKPVLDQDNIEQNAADHPARLDQLAYAMTGNPADWRQVADQAGIDDPAHPQAQDTLRMPAGRRPGAAT